MFLSLIGNSTTVELAFLLLLSFFMQSPPWQFPDLAATSKLGHDQEERVEDDDADSPGLADFHFKVTESKNMKPPMVSSSSDIQPLS